MYVGVRERNAICFVNAICSCQTTLYTDFCHWVDFERKRTGGSWRNEANDEIVRDLAGDRREHLVCKWL